jgi:hypothetical protein
MAQIPSGEEVADGAYTYLLSSSDSSGSADKITQYSAYNIVAVMSEPMRVSPDARRPGISLQRNRRSHGGLKSLVLKFQE